MKRIILSSLCLLAVAAAAQDDNKLTLSGSIQSDMLLP